MPTLQLGMRIRLPHERHCWGCEDTPVTPCVTVTIIRRDEDGTLWVAMRQGLEEWPISPLEAGCIVSVDGVRVKEEREAC